jgi:hypothetical protein
MRRPLLLAALLGLAVPAAFAAPYATASSATGSSTRGPVLVRDTEAGRQTAVINGKAVQPDTTTEPSIAVNPLNPNNVVAGYQMGRVDGGGDASNGYATTFDGGRTWKYGTIPGLTVKNGGPYDRASDAVVTFGPANVVYYSSLVFNDGSGTGGDTLRSAIVNSTSHDGGRTWDKPTVVIDDSGGGLNDKNWEVVDTGTAQGHHYGRLYVVWDRVAPMLVSYSDDQGKTFSPPSLVYAGQGIGAIPLVLKDGSLGVVFSTMVAPVPTAHTDPGGELAEPISGISKTVMAVAHEAGLLLSPAPLVFAPPTSVGVYAGHQPRLQRASPGLPTAAIDPNSGRVYVGWDDSRFRTEPSSPVNDPVITWSDDDGLTWSTLKNLRVGPSNDWVDRFNSMIGVGADGTVSVAYRQRQEAPAPANMSNFVDTFLVQSKDGGKTFSKPLKVNKSVRADARFAAVSRAGAMWGDYNELAVASDGTVYVVRCESYSVKRGEAAEYPPAIHHQRTWVAVVR